MPVERPVSLARWAGRCWQVVAEAAVAAVAVVVERDRSVRRLHSEGGESQWSAWWCPRKRGESGAGAGGGNSAENRVLLPSVGRPRRRPTMLRRSGGARPTLVEEVEKGALLLAVVSGRRHGIRRLVDGAQSAGEGKRTADEGGRGAACGDGVVKGKRRRGPAGTGAAAWVVAQGRESASEQASERSEQQQHAGARAATGCAPSRLPAGHTAAGCLEWGQQSGSGGQRRRAAQRARWTE